tara:strand:+ start:622 stop:810 length:189 start_codon:yes stop_codon:yes gene_type:complete
MITYLLIGILFAAFMEVTVWFLGEYYIGGTYEWNTFLRVLAILFWPICSIIFVIGFIKRWNK